MLREMKTLSFDDREKKMVDICVCVCIGVIDRYTLHVGEIKREEMEGVGGNE